MKCQAEWSTSWNQDFQEKFNHLRYADDTTQIVESKEELKSLLMKVKEKSKEAGLKLNIKQLSWFMLMSDRKQQNSVKQLFFD